MRTIALIILATLLLVHAELPVVDLKTIDFTKKGSVANNLHSIVQWCKTKGYRKERCRAYLEHDFPALLELREFELFFEGFIKEATAI